MPAGENAVMHLQDAASDADDNAVDPVACIPAKKTVPISSKSPVRERGY